MKTGEFREKKIIFWIVLACALAVFFLVYNKLVIGKEIFTHDSFIWMGSFYFFVDSLSNGTFPLWDPYSLTGTHFYPSIHGHGLLDPLVFVCVFMVKALKTAVSASYTYFQLLRLLIYALGAYYLFKQITKCRLSALLSACVLALSVAPTSYRQMGVLENAFLTPFTMYFTLKVFENANGGKKYVYTAAIALVTGISLNIFIPAYFAFNFIVFVFVLAAAGIAGRAEIKGLLTDRRYLAYSAAMILAVALMATPSFTLFMESRSAGGEHFPSVRIIQKNNGVFKKVVASDLADDVLSNKYTDSLGVYGSSGNLISLVYPDIWLSYFGQWSGFRRKGFRNDFISEAFQYVGMFPILIAIIGFIYAKSRFRLVAAVMTIVIALNLFSTYGVHSRPPNAIQTFFNTIFPLLKTMEVRETLSGFFLLYICMFLSMGLKIVFNRGEFNTLITEKWKELATVLGLLILAKILITWLLLRCAVYISKVDLIALLSIVFFGGLMFFYRKKQIREALFYSTIIAAIFMDLGYYNVTMKRFVLQPNYIEAQIAAAKGGNVKPKDFGLFRIPFVAFNGELPLAFSEPVFKVKGAMSRGNNHQFITSKRYYDYFTNVPLSKQFLLSGIIYPVVGFYAQGAVKTFDNRRDVLDYLSKAGEGEVLRYLALENNAAVSGGAGGRTFKALKEFEDAKWLNDKEVLNAFTDFYNMNKERFTENAKNPGNLISGAGYKVAVKGFGLNGVEMKVNNTNDGYLYYNDGWSKFWKAYDNGTELNVRPANYNFKAVYLAKGAHTVRFVFDPVNYKAAVALYYASVAILIALIAYLNISARIHRTRA